MKLYDKDFLLRLQQRDESAFTTLYNETADIFFRYLKATYFLDAAEIEDILSSFYVKLWNTLPRLKTDASFQARIRTIFKNLTKDYFKSHSAVHFSQIGWYDEEGSSFEDMLWSKEDVAELFGQEREYNAIVDAISSLEGDYKDILFWRFIEEKSYEEMASLLWLSQENVRQKISRGVKKLKIKLQTRS